MITASANKNPVNRPSLWAQGLGYGGLIPFVALAMAIWLLDPADRVLNATALLGYGATILSFLGAVHWGLAMRDGSAQTGAWFVWGVVPGLMAWVALLLYPVAGLCLLVIGLWACFAVDTVMYRRAGMQAWLSMRLMLTIVASLSCAASAFGLMR